MRWRVDAVLLAALVGLTALIRWSPVRAMDVALRDVADAHRPGWAYDLAYGLNWLGSGGTLTAVAAVLAVVVGWRRRSWRPVALVVGAFLLIVVLTEPVKLLVDRPAPHALDTSGVSYPSGHAVNTIVWYGVIFALAGWPAWNRLRFVPPAVVTLTATYLGFHWLTDMIAGLLLGLLIDRRLQTLTTSMPAAAKGATSSSVASSSVTRV